MMATSSRSGMCRRIAGCWPRTYSLRHYGVCVAISTTNDATGTYYLYQFPVVNSGFPDYPKWGTWVNDYGQTWNNFGPGGSGFLGPVLCALQPHEIAGRRQDSGADLSPIHEFSQLKTACCRPTSIRPLLLPTARTSSRLAA